MLRARLLLILFLALGGLASVAWFALRDNSDVGVSAPNAPLSATTGDAAGSGEVNSLVSSNDGTSADSAARRTAEPGGEQGRGGLGGRILLTDRSPLPAVEVVAFRNRHSRWDSPWHFLTEGAAQAPAERLAATQSQADGRFLFADLPAGVPLLLALAPGTGRTTIRFVERSPRPGETVDLGDILLPRGGAFTGRVVDPAGQPLAGVRVRAFDAMAHLDTDQGMDRFNGEGAIAVVNDGVAQVPVLSKLPVLGNLFMVEGQPAPGTALSTESKDVSLWAHRVQVEKEFQRATDLARSFAIDQGGNLAGEFRLAEGSFHFSSKPRGAPAFAARSMPDWSAALERDLSVPETRTDEEGRFRLEGVSGSRVHLWLFRRGYVPLRAGPFHCPEGGARDVGTLPLAAAAVVTGEVLDAAGQPVVGAEVLAGSGDGPDGLRFLSPMGRTEADGRFVADAPRQGQVLLAVRRNANEAWHVHGPVSVSDAVIRITLPFPPDLAVTVTAADGKPVPGVDVLATSAVRTRGGEGRFLPLRPALAAERSGAASFVLRRVPAEPLRITASAPGFVPTGAVWSASQRKPEEPAEVKLTLAPAAAGLLRVQAKGSNEPLAGVRAVGKPESFGAAAQLFPLRDPVVLGLSDQKGEIALRSLPAGNHTVLLYHPRWGWTQTQVTLPGDPVTVQLDAPGTLAGRVLEGGAPPRGPVRVALMGNGELPVQSEGHWILVPVAGDGTFRVEGLTPGTYDVNAAPDPSHVSSLHFHLDLAISSSPVAQQEVTILAGKETQVVLQLTEQNEAAAMGRIQGQVRVDGQAVPDLIVSLEGDREQETLSDEGGSFVFAAAAADTDLSLSVRMRGPGGQSVLLRQRTVRVARGETLDVPIQVDLARVRVRVVNGTSGAPLPRMHLTLNRTPGKDTGENSGSYEGTSDEQGACELLVPVGSCTVAAANQGWTLARTTPVALVRGSQELRVELLPGFRISGRIEEVGGTPTGGTLTFRGRTTGHQQNVGVRPDKAGGFLFRTRELPADTYEVTLMPRMDCAPVEVTVTAAQKDLVLQFRVGTAK